MMEQPDLIITAGRMLFSLAIVLGILFVGYLGLRRVVGKQAGGQAGQLINVLSSRYVGMKKQVSMVQIPGAILVLGVTNDRISLLSKIEDQNLIDTICRKNDGETAPSFSRQLRKMTQSLGADKSRS